MRSWRAARHAESWEATAMNGRFWGWSAPLQMVAEDVEFEENV